MIECIAITLYCRFLDAFAVSAFFSEINVQSRNTKYHSQTKGSETAQWVLAPTHDLPQAGSLSTIIHESGSMRLFAKFITPFFHQRNRFVFARSNLLMMGFIAVSVQHRLQFEAALDLAWSFFVRAYMNVFIPFVLSREFAQEVIRNQTEAVRAAKNANESARTENTKEEAGRYVLRNNVSGRRRNKEGAGRTSLTFIQIFDRASRRQIGTLPNDGKYTENNISKGGVQNPLNEGVKPTQSRPLDLQW